MPGYVFIGNSTKPTKKESKSRKNIKLSTVAKPCLMVAKEMGYDLYLGVNREKPDELVCDDMSIQMYDSHTYRSITALRDNWIAYKNLYNLIKNNEIDVIHCNSPVGGMIGRLVGHKCKVRRIIYTAHGFHFYKGAPLINRTLFKWAEQIMAHWTDVIITMNNDDYDAAKHFKLRNAGSVYKIHGVGIDRNRFSMVFSDEKKQRKKIEIGVPSDAKIILSVGELNKNKNHEIVIKALAKLKDKKIHYVIAGIGNLEKYLLKLAKDLEIDHYVHLIGYRSDMVELYSISDIFIHPSLREGLPASIMEAMASGLPCIVSRIRGNVDLIENGKGGILCDPNNADDFSSALNLLINDKEMCDGMSTFNQEVIKNYDIHVVEEEIRKIYEEVFQ